MAANVRRGVWGDGFVSPQSGLFWRFLVLAGARPGNRAVNRPCLRGCAIALTSFNAEGQVIATMPGSHIRIEANTVTKTPRSGVWVESVASGTVLDNDIFAASTNPTLGPDAHLPTGLSKQQAVQDFHSPILLLNSDVTKRGNIVTVVSSAR